MSYSPVQPSSAHHVLSRLSTTIRDVLEPKTSGPDGRPEPPQHELSLVDSDGVLVGVLDPLPDLDELEPKTREIVTTLLDAYDFVLRAETDRRRDEQQLERMEREAYSDCLTGLPNRRAWERALEREQARCDRQDETRVAAVMVDVDGLKQTNDLHGHRAGDLLLCQTADALRHAFRATDIVARIGGDEFGGLAVDYVDSDPGLLVERVRTALSAAGIAASVGMATHDPERRLTDVVAMADAAMYAQKRRPLLQAEGHVIDEERRIQQAAAPGDG